MWIVLWLSLLTVSLQAQANTFRVEVIVFQNNDESALYEEHFSRDVVLSDHTLQTQLPQSPALGTLMGDVWQKLSNSIHYTPVLKTHWTQDALSPTQASWVEFQSDEALPNVKGFIRLYQKRFLHVDVEALLNRAVPEDYAQYWLNNSIQSDKTLFTEQSFYLKQNRKVETNRLYYFDSPIFGVLLYITRE